MLIFFILWTFKLLHGIFLINTHHYCKLLITATVILILCESVGNAGRIADLDLWYLLAQGQRDVM